jgi:hypothetical protein
MYGAADQGGEIGSGNANQESEGIIGKGAAVFMREGVAGFIKGSLRYFLSPIFTVTTYTVYERHLQGSIEELKPKTADCIVRLVTCGSELSKLAGDGFDFSSNPNSDSYFQGFDKGAVLFLVFIAKRLAHSSWLSFHHDGAVFDPLFQRIDFGETAYIGPCNTFNAFRRLGLYSYILTRICRFLREQGVYRAVINTRNKNIPSVQGIVKAGFVPLCSIRKYKVLGRIFFVRRNRVG